MLNNVFNVVHRPVYMFKPSMVHLIYNCCYKINALSICLV